jgi:RecA-family ATPase
MNGPFNPADYDYFPSGEPLASRPVAKRRKLALVNAASFAGKALPPRDWLVENLIPMRQVTLLYGDGATGKTLVELQLGVAVATGTDWLGTLPKDGNVLILSAEDDIDETHRRLADIVAGRDFGLPDLGGLTIVPLAGEDALLAVAGRGGMLRGLAIKYNIAVVVLAHPSLSGMSSGNGTSGNTAWSNSARSPLYLEQVKGENGEVVDETLRRLTVKKANYAKAGTEITIRWERGRFVLSNTARKASLSNIDTLFLALLAQFTNEGRNVTHKKGTSYAPSEFANHPDGKCVRKEAFKASMDRLLKAGEIKIVEHGPPSKRHSKIISKDANS